MIQILQKIYSNLVQNTPHLMPKIFLKVITSEPGLKNVSAKRLA
jgi:hypothetical protein